MPVCNRILITSDWKHGRAKKNAKLDEATIITDFGLHISSGKVKFFQQYDLDFAPGEREAAISMISKAKAI